MVQNILTARVPDAYLPVPRDGSAGTPAGTSAAPASAGVASAEHDVTGSLSVVTKDGDTVTLSASFDAAATYGGVRRGGSGASFASAQVNRSVSLTVQGDLSRQELHEIRQVVQRFMHDLREMVQGGQPSLANVIAVHAHTLASISASSDTQDTLTAVAVSVRPLPVPVPVIPAGNDLPQDSPARRAPVSGEDADTIPPLSPMVSARGFRSPTPVVTPLYTEVATPVRS